MTTTAPPLPFKQMLPYTLLTLGALSCILVSGVVVFEGRSIFFNVLPLGWIGLVGVSLVGGYLMADKLSPPQIGPALLGGLVNSLFCGGAGALLALLFIPPPSIDPLPAQDTLLTSLLLALLTPGLPVMIGLLIGASLLTGAIIALLPGHRYGLMGGVAIIFVCLVGMVEKFEGRSVIFAVISLGRALLCAISLGVGFAAASQLSWERDIRQTLLIGLTTGLTSSLMVIVFAMLIAAYDIREMFLSDSPALVEILLFAQNAEGSGLLLLGGTLTGLSLLGAALYLLPGLLRRMVIAGLVAVLLVGTLAELINVHLLAGNKSLGFLFAQQGLSLWGAILVFGVFAGLNGVWNSRGRTQLHEMFAGLPASQQKAVNWGGMALGLILLLLLPQLTNDYISQIGVWVGLFTLMGLGMNIEIGLAGLLDLGFVGFYAIGAYTVALMTSTGPLGLSSVLAGETTRASFSSFWTAIPVAVLLSAAAGVFLGIPVLRMRGDYLAIVTLGLAQIISVLVKSNLLKDYLGGAQGILNIPKPRLELLDVVIKDPGDFYYVILAGCLMIGFMAAQLQNGRIGRNWMAMREDEDVAEAMGINLIASKLLAFGIGAAFAGLSGAIFAAQLGSVFPQSFELLLSINVVALVIVGGQGSIPGVVVGALVLVGLPELLSEFNEFRLLIYGTLLVVMMLVKPEGLWPSEVRRRELHAEEGLNG
jgi:branched-chain amino acid transport system permease protein